MHMFLLAENRKDCTLLGGLVFRILFIHTARYKSHLHLIPELKSSFEVSKPD